MTAGTATKRFMEKWRRESLRGEFTRYWGTRTRVRVLYLRNEWKIPKDSIDFGLLIKRKPFYFFIRQSRFPVFSPYLRKMFR